MTMALSEKEISMAGKANRRREYEASRALKALSH